jgi:thiol:disulfide interchange protein
MPSRVNLSRILSLAILLSLSTVASGDAGGDRGKGGNLVKWRTIAAGEAESRASKKPVFYFLTADWCGPCHMMKAQIFADPEMAGLINKQFIPVQVVDRRREDGQNAPEVDAVFRRFRPNGLPTLVVARPAAKQGLSAVGWTDKAGTREFLTIARDRLAELEKAAKD